MFFEDYPSNSEIIQHDKLEREWRSFQKEMWNPFIDRVDADLETLNGLFNRHRQLLDNNLKWQRRGEELAGRHEQRISELEKNLEEKEVYISNIECMLADLSGRVNKMEGKLCRCHKEDVKVAEVEDDDDPTSELSYKTVYHTPVAIAGLLEDVPHQLVPIGDLEITRGGFEEEVRDGDEDSDQRLESVASQVVERVLEEDENNKQVACVSHDWLSHELTLAFQIRSDEESSDGTDIEHYMHPVGRVCILAEESRLIDCRILILSQMVTALRSIPSRPRPSSVSVATQTVVRTYADASVEVLNVRCMPWAEFLQKMRELVQENALTRIYALLQEMRSSMEAAAAGIELMLNMELAQVRSLQGAFVPIEVAGDLTPESDEGGHLTDTGGKNACIQGLHGDYIVIF